MLELADRVVIEQLAQIRRAVTDFERQNRLATENLSPIFDVLEQLNLLQLGAARARWLLRQDAYLPARSLDLRLVADLVQGVSLLAREFGVVFVGESEAGLQMRKEGQVLAMMVPASAAGVLNWVGFEAALAESRLLRKHQSGDPVIVLAAGVSGNRAAIAPPENLIDNEDADDNASDVSRPIIIDVNELRADPASALAILR